MLPIEYLHRALERRRALLRARDLEIARARELRSTVAVTVLRSRDVNRRARALLDQLQQLRRARNPLSAETVS